MLDRTGGFKVGMGQGPCPCGCDAPATGPGMGGFFSTILNVAGAYVGDPALGSQIAAKALPGYAQISETPQQIAARVAPAVQASLAAGKPIVGRDLSPQAQQIGAGIAADVAAELRANGVMLAPGTVGAELQRPSVLDAFGGGNRRWVLVGGLALGALLLWKGGV